MIFSLCRYLVSHVVPESVKIPYYCLKVVIPLFQRAFMLCCINLILLQGNNIFVSFSYQK